MASHSEQNIDQLLRDLGAWQTGHFLYSSGLHGDQYLQCQQILQYPRYGQTLADEMARLVLASGLKPAVVVGPALGAVHWELLVAMALDKQSSAEGKPIRAIFAERSDGGSEFEIRRGITVGAGEKILVVEDVTTTGGSARKVVDLIRKLGGEPIAVGAIVDRSGGAVSFDVPFISLVKLNLETFKPENCPLCQKGVPLVKPGSTKHKK